MATSDILNSLSAGLGGGSGIDVTSTVNQLLANLRGPEQVWQTQQKLLQVQASALTQLNTEVGALETAVDSLNDSGGALLSRSASSSQPGILTATAANNAPVGSHTVVVNNLATSASYYSAPLASSTTPLTNGTFTVKVGSANAVTVTIDNTNNTLDGLAAAINNQAIGVSASVINDASGARLAVVSNTSGAPGDLTITDQAGGLTFTKGATGTNANITVDGVPISSANNVVAGSIAGLTINLIGAAPGTAVQVSVSQDTDKIKQAIEDFVTAYNTIVQDLSSQFTYNTTTQSAGPLAADTAARLVQTQMLSAATYAGTGTNAFNTLASMGLNMNNDGTLSIDENKLNDAINGNFNAVQNFFHAQDGTGFSVFMKQQLNALTDSTQGAFYIDLQGNSSAQQSFQDQIDNYEIYIATQKTLLTTQYTQVDLMLRQLPALQQQIEGQLSSFSNSSK